MLLIFVKLLCSVKQRCIAEQKRRKQRATKKISIFIGSFIICFAPYVITRYVAYCFKLNILQTIWYKHYGLIWEELFIIQYGTHI